MACLGTSLIAAVANKTALYTRLVSSHDCDNSDARGGYGFNLDDRDHDGPQLKKESLFRQVTDFVAVVIMSGRYKVGELLPNEDDLRSVAIPRQTVQKQLGV